MKKVTLTIQYLITDEEFEKEAHQEVLKSFKDGTMIEDLKSPTNNVKVIEPVSFVKIN